MVPYWGPILEVKVSYVQLFGLKTVPRTQMNLQHEALCRQRSVSPQHPGSWPKLDILAVFGISFFSFFFSGISWLIFSLPVPTCKAKLSWICSFFLFPGACNPPKTFLVQQLTPWENLYFQDFWGQEGIQVVLELAVSTLWSKVALR